MFFLLKREMTFESAKMVVLIASRNEKSCHFASDPDGKKGFGYDAQRGLFYIFNGDNGSELGFKCFKECQINTHEKYKEI